MADKKTNKDKKKKRKKFFNEFKTFALKGNMIDLAVGMIIGSAFNSIVNSFVNDMVMPLLGLVTGKIDFSQLYIPLDGKSYASLKEAEEAGVSCFKFGSFISGLINFFIMAFVVFLLVKGINRLREALDGIEDKLMGDEEEKPAAPTTKKCPFCQSEISIKATRCPHCTSELPKDGE